MTGLTITENYISEHKSNQLISKLEEMFKDSKTSEYGGRDRFIRRFGSKKPYGNNVVSGKIPTFLNWFIDEIVFDDIMREPDHVTCNMYLEGQTIPFHVDSRESGDVITVLSLGTDATMLLRHAKNRKDLTTINLPPNSLLQLKAEARWDYQHSILPVKTTRYSIVLRKSN